MLREVFPRTSTRTIAPTDLLSEDQVVMRVIQVAMHLVTSSRDKN